MVSKRSVGKAIKQGTEEMRKAIKDGLEAATEVIATNSCSPDLSDKITKINFIDGEEDLIKKSDDVIRTASSICNKPKREKFEVAKKAYIKANQDAEDASTTFFINALEAASDIMKNDNCSDENVGTVNRALAIRDSVTSKEVNDEDPTYRRLKASSLACTLPRD